MWCRLCFAALWIRTHVGLPCTLRLAKPLLHGRGGGGGTTGGATGGVGTTAGGVTGATGGGPSAPSMPLTIPGGVIAIAVAAANELAPCHPWVGYASAIAFSSAISAAVAEKAIL